MKMSNEVVALAYESNERRKKNNYIKSVLFLCTLLNAEYFPILFSNVDSNKFHIVTCNWPHFSSA